MTTKKLVTTKKVMTDPNENWDHPSYYKKEKSGDPVKDKLERLCEKRLKVIRKIRELKARKEEMEVDIFNTLVENRMDACLKVDWNGFHNQFKIGGIDFDLVFKK